MVSKRVETVSFSGIRKFFELVSQKKGIISLGVGEPDFPTPDKIKEAGIEAIMEDITSYTSNYGDITLRRLIAEKLEVENEIKADPEKEIVVTSGASEAIDLAVRALVNPGEDVLIVEPSYVAYKPVVLFTGANPVPVPTYEEEGFKVSYEALERAYTYKTTCLILNTPNNPTGAVLEEKRLREISEFAIEKEIYVIVDEIYEKLVYDGKKQFSMASIPEMDGKIVTVNGFSKGYAMTGWRIGYAVADERLTSLMMKIHQYTELCAPSISQYAAARALMEKDISKPMIREFDRRRRLIYSKLREMGFSVSLPEGAFYIFPRIPLNMNSEEFSRYLLEKASVAVVPGIVFGECGEGYVRMTYANSRENIREAMERINEAISPLL